jgi:hypothetical protein
MKVMAVSRVFSAEQCAGELFNSQFKQASNALDEPWGVASPRYNQSQ